MKSRYHRIDGWRGYTIPGSAVAGSSDTGTWSDSPCPSDKVVAELARFRKECLRPAGIRSVMRFGGSSNVFCGKRWVCVSASDWEKANELTTEWLKANDRNTHYIHNAF